MCPQVVPESSTSSNAKNSDFGSSSSSSSFRDPRERWCWQGVHFCNAIMAMITRIMFMLHAMIALWRVVVSTDGRHWSLGLLLLGLLIETVVILLTRRGVEWKWFQWSVFLYLLSIIPSVWILELQKIQRFESALENQTHLSFEIQTGMGNFETMTMKTDDWITFLEQSILVVIIVSRWMLPKGDMTRDQLSSLLLIHLGTSSDIIDFLTVLTEKNAVESTVFTYTVLFFWSWSFMQFPFVVTVKAETNESDEEERNELELEVDGVKVKKSIFQNFRAKLKTLTETEVWGVLISVTMQDGPFALMRLTAIFAFKIVTYTNLFFTAKNVMVLVLQIYRIFALCIEYQDAKAERRKALKLRLKNLYGIA